MGEHKVENGRRNEARAGVYKGAWAVHCTEVGLVRATKGPGQGFSELVEACVCTCVYLEE